MAIDFYYLNEKDYKKPLFQIEENDLLLVEDTLIKLEKLTGMVLDAYGKSRLYPDHVKLWLRLLDESVPKNSDPKSTKLKILELITFLKRTTEIDAGLIILGD